MRELITSVRDNSESDIPDPFLEKALYVIIKDLRNQVTAHNRVKYKSVEQTPQPHSHPILTPAPTQTPGPFSNPQAPAAVFSGQTTITLRRVNKHSIIRAQRVF